MIGQTISHYKITAKLGAGGMGEVYLAEDLQIGRKVAVKFLSADKSSDEESRQRFIHEAHAQAMLNHPNIATFYEVGEADGRAFIVMEYIDGKPLSDAVRADKLSLTELLGFVTQVAEGLQAAHEKGVIHRDIKPENIMVTSKGLVKITDFGLARWKGATTITKSGTRMGTVSYMSPEQAEGKKVDHRSDVFSLGVVLYELVAGRPPFEGDHEAAITYSIVNETPKPLARYDASVSDTMEQIATKCLAKRREERYQSCADLVADLRLELRASEPSIASTSRFTRKGSRRGLLIASLIAVLFVVLAVVLKPWQAFFGPDPGTSGERPMLAVLPFENLGSDDQEYFADGITEEITARLAKIGGLGIIARTSTIQYKNTDKSIREIGEELGVDFILEGTIRWERSDETQDRVRVTPQLIKVADATHLWAEIYDEWLTSVFRVQADIAAQITEALGVALLEPERQVISTQPTANMDAYDYYLRGMDHQITGAETVTEPDLLAAIEMLSRAVDTDPRFAVAFARLSAAHTTLYFWYDKSSARMKLARDAVDSAFALQPNLPEAHLSLGYYFNLVEQDYDRALHEFERARTGLSSHSDLFSSIALVQMRQGRWSESLANYRRAADLDPRSSGKNSSVALVLTYMRQYVEAEFFVDRAISLDPTNQDVYWQKIWLHLLAGDTAKARQVIPAASRHIARTDAMWIGSLFGVYNLGFWRFGLVEEDPQQLQREFSDSFAGSSRQVYYFCMGQLYDLQDRPDSARVFYDSARVFVETELQYTPDDSHLHCDLALACAFLGRQEESIREGELAMELMPIRACHW